MNRRTVNAAIKAAEDFIDAARAAKAELEESNHWVVGTKNTGALRRASMDLTRRLADMRKPD